MEVSAKFGEKRAIEQAQVILNIDIKGR